MIITREQIENYINFLDQQIDDQRLRTKDVKAALAKAENLLAALREQRDAVAVAWNSWPKHMLFIKVEDNTPASPTDPRD